MRPGLTLLEVAFVIIIMGVITAIITPRFLDLSDKAIEGAAMGSLGAMRGAVAFNYASNAAYKTAPPYNPVTIEASMFQNGMVPEEMYTKSRAVEIGPSDATPSGTAGGWFYDSANGRVFINHTDYSMY